MGLVELNRGELVLACPVLRVQPILKQLWTHRNFGKSKRELEAGLQKVRLVLLQPLITFQRSIRKRFSRFLLVFGFGLL